MSSAVRSGFTWRSLIILLYIVFVFPAVLIYLNLITGSAPAGALILSALLVSLEITRLSGSPLTIQETSALLMASGVIGSSLMVTNWVFQSYYAQSPILHPFGLYGKVPGWWAPPPETQVFNLRTFFHSAWSLPLSLSMTTLILSLFGSFSLGMLNKRLWLDVESLTRKILERLIEYDIRFLYDVLRYRIEISNMTYGLTLPKPSVVQ